jgi:hypothetical protein
MQQALWSELPERSLPKGERLKAEGMRIVLDNQNEKWTVLAQQLMHAYIYENEPCLMEDARAFALECGLPQPSHPNAWGAAVSGMAKRGEIEMTGQWTKAESVKSHASMYPLWRAA